VLTAAEPPARATRRETAHPCQRSFDIAVVGGGPSGVAAALWAARYRRRIVLIDAGEQRNRWTKAAHGYLGLEGEHPMTLIEVARRDLGRYPEVEVLDRRRVITASSRVGVGFELELDDGATLHALRVVLATGVRDVFPRIDGFEHYFGQSVFTCPSCDGYEAQGKSVAVVGDSPEIAEFALGLLDWASSVVAIRAHSKTSSFNERARQQLEVDEVVGTVVAIEGHDGHLRSLRLDSGATVECEIVFWLLDHVQQSDLAQQLGCDITPDGCVSVDDQGATSVAHVYAAGDTTPGPHLVQLAAAEGARAGIAAAMSLRGQPGSPLSAPPAPNAEGLVDPAPEHR